MGLVHFGVRLDRIARIIRIHFDSGFRFSKTADDTLACQRDTGRRVAGDRLDTGRQQQIQQYGRQFELSALLGVWRPVVRWNLEFGSNHQSVQDFYEKPELLLCADSTELRQPENNEWPFAVPPSGWSKSLSE